MARRHTRPKERRRPRPIPQELKEEQKVREEYKRTPMMPEIPEMEEFDIQEYEKKKTKDRRKRIKKNPRKNWKELGLLEKRGLA